MSNKQYTIFSYKKSPFSKSVIHTTTIIQVYMHRREKRLEQEEEKRRKEEEEEAIRAKGVEITVNEFI